MKSIQRNRTKPPKPAGPQVRAYVAAREPEVRKNLKKIRAAIRAAAPRAVEVFSYGIPGFRIDGQPLVWYAAWKNHYSMYPVGPAVLRSSGMDPSDYKTSKGTVQFPADNPPSATLVRRLVKARLAQLPAKGKR